MEVERRYIPFRLSFCVSGGIDRKKGNESLAYDQMRDRVEVLGALL